LIQAPATRVTLRRGRLPGFGLSLGITLGWLSLLVLLPLAVFAWKAAAVPLPKLYAAISGPRGRAAFSLTFGAAAIAASVNVVFGFTVAWVLARYRFFGRAFVDALVDLPFALPTAVAGIALTAIWAPTGWLGARMASLGIATAYSPTGVTIALVFVGLPFVVRSVEPVIHELDPALEEAAAVLGASRWRTFVAVTLPAVAPALLGGFTMAFARALGEYGSVVFISGNMPLRTEVLPLLIVTRLEQYDYDGAIAIALATLICAFALLSVMGVLQSRLRPESSR
jgi:sulfate transport system permease protein